MEPAKKELALTLPSVVATARVHVLAEIVCAASGGDVKREI